MINEEILREKYDACLATIYEIKQLFIDEFTEEKIDMQIPNSISFNAFKRDFKNACLTEEEMEGTASFISWFNGYNVDFYVYWPTVTIVNDSNRKHEIKDLYAKVPVTVKGLLYESRGFLLNRTTYTQAEWDSDYLHSHIPGIPKTNISSFKSPCTGSGPINAAISNLRQGNTDARYDKEWFAAFLYELNRYVYVESLAGVPYRKMTNIHIGNHNARSSRRTLSLGNYRTSPSIRNEYKPMLQAFFTHILVNNTINFNFDGSIFLIAETKNELWLKISNAFIDWYNENQETYGFTLNDLISYTIILPCVWEEPNFITMVPPSTSADAAVGRKVLTFKGEVKRLNILNKIENTVTLEENTMFILNSTLMTNYLTLLPQIINQYYGRS